MLKEDRGNYVDRNDHDKDDKDDDGEQDDGDDKVDANLAITPLSSLLIFLNSFSASLILNYLTSENWLQWEKAGISFLVLGSLLALCWLDQKLGAQGGEVVCWAASLLSE